MHPNNDQKIFEKLTFFDQNGVKKIFFYFSLNTLPTTFKINQAKKILDQKIFLPKGIVRPLGMGHFSCMLSKIEPTIRGFSIRFSANIQ